MSDHMGRNRNPQESSCSARRLAGPFTALCPDSPGLAGTIRPLRWAAPLLLTASLLNTGLLTLKSAVDAPHATGGRK